MKNLNLVKQLNKKTKRKKRHFSTNFKGKVIDGLHELYTLSAGMMLGIRYSVGKLSGPVGEAADNLTITDFSFVEKVTFPPDGSEKGSSHITPPHQLAHTFKFKSYCPKIFKRLRDFFDTDAASYMLSVCGDYNFIEFISNSKSGQFFFYSHDGKYMIKTQTKEENKFLKRILPHYYKYLTENPHSSLVRIFGMYRVKMYHLRRKVHFVIMVSVFDTPVQINTIYDLKGSSVGRSVSKEDRAKGAVLKDNDLLEDGTKIHLGYKKKNFLEQLRKDAEFLASLNIMDYSLLVGIHDRKSRVNNGSASTESVSVPALTTHSLQPMSSSTAVGNASPSFTPVRSASTDIIGLFSPVAAMDNEPEQDSSHQRGEDSITSQGEAGGTARLSMDMDPGSPSHLLNASPGTAPARRQSMNSRSNTPFRRVTYSNFPPPAATTSSSSQDEALSAHKLRVSRSRDRHSTDDTTSSSAAALADPAIALSHSREEPELSGEELEELEEEDDQSEEDSNGDEEFEDIDEGDSDEEEEDAGHHPHHHHHHGHHHHGEDARRSIDEAVVSAPLSPPPLQKVGEGALGEEGYRLSQIFRHSQLQSSLARKRSASVDRASIADPTHLPPPRSQLTSEHENMESLAYSPGITTRKPWTSRVDGGINSRLQDGKHGDEIYFIGIIDILQQYNIGKKAETFFKGFTHDVKQLSSIDSVAYAKRFVKFMEQNID